MSILIKEISLDDKKGLINFYKMANIFYRGNPYFVPPLVVAYVSTVYARRNPFFEHGDIAHFIAYRDGGLAGRIAAIVNENHNKTHNDNIGFFGFFECFEDQEVANALIEQASLWLKNRGKDAIRGPLNPTMNDEVGLLIDNFDDIPAVLTPYNNKYYAELIENAGFTKAMDLYSYLFTEQNFLTEKIIRTKDIVIKRNNIEFRNIDFKNKLKFAEDVQIIKGIYNDAWEANWGHVKLTDNEFEKFVKDLKMIADPDLIFIAYTNGEPAGVCLALPDVNQALVYNKKGSLIGAGIKMFTKKRKIKRCRIVILGVLEKHRKTGIDAAMYYEIGMRGKKKGYTSAEASWILETNDLINRGLTQIVDGKLYKKHRIYEKKIL